MPVIEVGVSPDDCHVQSPLLFWAIIAIAARHDEEEPTVMGSLAPFLKTLLWQTIGSPPHTRSDLKAMVLLCLWPMPTSSMSTDPSFVLASACKSSAMHVGVHKPHSAQDFTRIRTSPSREEVKDALTTWSACFIAAER